MTSLRGLAVLGVPVRYGRPGGRRVISVPIPAVWDRPPAVGVNEGAAGVAFGAEDNPDQIGGQRADNLVVTDYELLNELPVQE
jgi:hypothetical protein